MTSLTIQDLHESKRLDGAARKAIYGGVNDWISTYTPRSALRGAIIGQVNNYLLMNPVFNILNQYELVNIDASQNFDSLINIVVDQANAGSNSAHGVPAIPAMPKV